jgi:hypothetical protein
MTETLEQRVEKLERSYRRLMIVASLALIVALAAKVFVIWIATTRPAPELPKPPERIASVAKVTSDAHRSPIRALFAESSELA